MKARFILQQEIADLERILDRISYANASTRNELSIQIREDKRILKLLKEAGC